MAIHLQTSRTEQAELVVCPGDPERAELAARELLDGAVLVTSARGLLGFSGRYRGTPVTIQATGMGGGSTAIVVHELIELGARCLVRAGTTGGLQPDLTLGSIVVADAAVADDGAAVALVDREVPAPDLVLTRALVAAASSTERPVHVGTVVSTDLFYDPVPGRPEAWMARGILSVEMEAAVLFALAARHRVRAGCVLTVSNQLLVADAEWFDDAFRQTAGIEVCRIALDALVADNAANESSESSPRRPR